MLRIGICDNIVEEVEKEEQMVRRIVDKMGIKADIRKCYSGMELLMEIDVSGQFQIILLDIELGGMNGIETARKIRKEDIFCNIIFITAFEQYSKEAIGVHPYAFIDKPMTGERLQKLIHEIYNRLQLDESFSFMSHRIYFNISLNRILYFMSEKRRIYLCDMDHTYTFYDRMNHVEESIQKKQVEFWRIHHSFFINPHYIQEYRYERIMMQNGTMLEISRQKRQRIRLLYMKRLERYR